MAYEHILVEIEAPIATVTLNRPKVLNALSPDLIRELTTAMSDLDADDSVRAVVLTGGAKVFAAGGDICGMADPGPGAQPVPDQSRSSGPPAGCTKPPAAGVNRYARQLAEKPPLAVRMAKEAVLRAFDSPLSEGLAAERKSFYFLFATEDQKEGMHAFLEKRKGVFKGR